MTPIPDSELPELARTQVRRLVRSDKKTRVTLHLRHRDRPPSPEDLGHHPHQRGYLSLEEFAERHGASDDDLAEIAAFAEEYQLNVKSVHKAGRMVELVGNVGAMNQAFGVEIHERSDARGNSLAHHGPIHLPPRIADIVDHVTGLDTRDTSTRLRPEIPHADPQQLLESMQKFLCYFPTEVAEAYNFPGEFDGSGQTIGILEFGGGYKSSDIEEYFQHLGIPMPEIVEVSVGSGRNRPSDPPTLNDLEVTLDIQIAGSVAPGARLVVYFLDGSTESMAQAIKSAVFDDTYRPSVLSISFGVAEKMLRRQDIRLVNQVLQDAALMGVTVCAASGDAGSATNDYAQFPPPPSTHVVFPASSPYVLACGGTSLQRKDDGAYRETVWNNLNQGRTSSGGGVSQVFERPDYQSRESVPPNADPDVTFAGRGVPDVSGNADFETGYKILFNGSLFPGGGTSAVAPLWAGLIARLNHGLGTRVGFLNPLLYQLAGTDALRSITEGSNGAYAAQPGWDACTGLGVPNGAVLLQMLRGQSPAVDETQPAPEQEPSATETTSSPPQSSASTVSETVAEAMRIAAEASRMAELTLGSLRNSRQVFR